MKIYVSDIFRNVSKPLWLLTGILLLIIIATLDYITGPDISLSFFYLIPIALFAWHINSHAGVAIAILSAALWFVIETISRPPNISIFIHLWNAIIRLGFFFLPTLFMEILKRERRHARTDYLTGAVNHRYFHEQLQMEVDRSARYDLSFTVAFIDTDNFKTVNDTFGHIFGDEILKAIVWTMKKSLRKTDLIARVGGDEFSILLPETNDMEARAAISNMCHKLKDEMQAQKCPITFSVGVLTLSAPQISSDQILNRVDKIMYMVKNSGKDNIRYEVYREKTGENLTKRSTPPTLPRF